MHSRRHGSAENKAQGAYREIREGEVIKGPFWSEPVKVEKIERKNDHIRIVGCTINSKRHVDQLIGKGDMDRVEVVESKIDLSSDPENVFLAIEATRFRHASLFDPLLAMNVSKIDPLPFQIEAVYGYVLKQPRIRFLIADDPGAGKTIMAGLILKELKLRGLVRRVLIVVPGHLKDQWRRELKEKFNEKFLVMDRSIFNAHYGENPWERNDQVITSIDFAKQDDMLKTLSSVRWDLVIVDEAHKMSAYRYGGKVSKTQRYKLGEVLSRTSDHLLFLTATPLSACVSMCLETQTDDQLGGWLTQPLGVGIASSSQQRIAQLTSAWLSFTLSSKPDLQDCHSATLCISF